MSKPVVEAICEALTRRPLAPGPITLLKVLRDAGPQGFERSRLAEAMRWGDEKGLTGVLGAFYRRLAGTSSLGKAGKDAVIRSTRSEDDREFLSLTEDARAALESIPELLEWLELECDAIHERAFREGRPRFKDLQEGAGGSKAIQSGSIDRADLVRLFRAFRSNPRFQVVVRVRDHRAREIRDLMEREAQIGLEEFNRDIWRIETKTVVRGERWPEPLADRCSSVEAAHIVEDALDRGEVELHGNYIWREGTKRYGVNVSLSDEELENNLQLMREILLDDELSPLQKAAKLRGIPGFGKGVSSGLASIFHPDDVIQLNNRSQDFMAMLGLSRNLSLADYCSEMRQLADEVGARDFLELDYFLYVLSAGELSLPVRSPARYFWVNQDENFEAEMELGLLRAGTAGEDGSLDQANVGELEPGDLVFHHRRGEIVAVSQPRAPGVDLEDDEESEEGRRWFCFVDYVTLPKPVALAPLVTELAGLSTEHGPVDSRGGVKRGYLFQLSEAAARRLALAVVRAGADRGLFSALEPLEGGEEPPEAPRATMTPKNTILYGPPGTGKTYRTTAMAVELCMSGDVESMPRDELRAHYRRLREERRIEFVTFHQSYSYEEFVEGIRPTLGGKGEDGDVGYECRPGVFRSICDRADLARRARGQTEDRFELAGRTIWKFSVGNIHRDEQQQIYDSAIENKRIYLGYGQGLDYSGCSTPDQIRDLLRLDHAEEAEGYSARAVQALKNEMQIGDVVIVPAGLNAFRAIGVITGEYERVAAPLGNFHQSRPVRWLRVLEEPASREKIARKRFGVATIHKLKPNTILAESLEDFINSTDEDIAPSPVPVSEGIKQFVLVIDEINRGNISRILGELITLLEPDKRLGQEHELTVTLPYSGDEFGVPPNLHVVGTMNTADRSIAFLDTALRRRFRFEEVFPDADVLRRHVGADGVLGGVDVARLLEVMNRRIEVLLDRDHQLGHSYLMKVASLDDLRETFASQIVPLLQEYFYDEWQKTCAVLGCSAGTPTEKAIVLSEEVDEPGLAESIGFGEEIRRHRINPRFLSAEIGDLRPYFQCVLDGGGTEAEE